MAFQRIKALVDSIIKGYKYWTIATAGLALMIMFILRAVTSLPWYWNAVGGASVIALIAALAIFVAERGDELGWREGPITLGIAVLEMEPGEPIAIPTIGAGEPMDHATEMSVADRRSLARELFQLAEQEVHYLLAHAHDNYTLLREQASGWQQTVRSILESNNHCSEADRSSFRVITPFSPRGWSGVTPDHAHLFEEVFERIERLRAIARRVESQG